MLDGCVIPFSTSRLLVHVFFLSCECCAAIYGKTIWRVMRPALLIGMLAVMAGHSPCFRLKSAPADARASGCV